MIVTVPADETPPGPTDSVSLDTRIPQPWVQFVEVTAAAFRNVVISESMTMGSVLREFKLLIPLYLDVFVDQPTS